MSIQQRMRIRKLVTVVELKRVAAKALSDLYQLDQIKCKKFIQELELLSVAFLPDPNTPATATSLPKPSIKEKLIEFFITNKNTPTTFNDLAAALKTRSLSCLYYFSSIFCKQYGTEEKKNLFNLHEHFYRNEVIRRRELTRQTPQASEAD